VVTRLSGRASGYHYYYYYHYSGNGSGRHDHEGVPWWQRLLGRDHNHTAEEAPERVKTPRNQN